ncbi:DUF1345 domain-containing protein [Mesorhizobium sp. BAC0120]|uniref:DUF1345 domain-containing protein n=1 Tax=Mesorhizobium sp. BAC0120 TaxID=3090670 RepID=UPI00298D2F07|nr:DUF1345 domain-containing protein [Mesorhizobium sp. BAC0120]MDW6022748.1 DUF1345 domain-containing protein [Mesorhizobium sp. BAC0120]
MNLSRHKRHAPFYIAVLCALATAPIALWLRPKLAIEATANIFFLVYLVLTGIKITRLSAAFLKKHAARTDEPAWAILAVTFGAVIVAVISLFIVINSHDKHDILTVSLSLASVALGWLTIHTMAAIHYAHRYWQPNVGTDGRGSSKNEPRGGLEFPGTEEPEGFDFLYFSFVIGMTAQTSDVQITTTAMRRVNLLHAVISFMFNTVLVAAAVNVAVSLGPS